MLFVFLVSPRPLAVFPDRPSYQARPFPDPSFLPTWDLNLRRKYTSLAHMCLPAFSADSLPSDPVQPQYGAWLSLVDRAQVKAFVDLTLSPSVRQGAQHLLRISGLGELPSAPSVAPLTLLPAPRE